MNKDDNDRVFDVSKPNKSAPSPTSRPIIVGHHPMMGDPMVKEDSENHEEPEGPPPVEHKSIPIHSPDDPAKAPEDVSPTLAPAMVHHPESVKAAVSPFSGLDEASEPTHQMSSDDSHLASVDELMRDEPKPPEHQHHDLDLHPHHEHGSDEPASVAHPAQRGRVTGDKKLTVLLAVLLVLVAGYLAIDSRLIKTSIKLPFHVFKQPAAVTPTAPVAQPTSTKTTTTQSTTTEPVSTDPYANWKTYTSSAEPTLSFKYPSDWKLTKNQDSFGVDSANLNGPNGSNIYWGAASAGVGGNCDPKDTMVINSADAISGATGLYVVSTTITAYESSTGASSTTPQTQQDISVMDKAPDGTAPPKAGSYKGCIYPSRFTSRKGDRAFTFAAGSAFSTADLPTIKLILGSLKY